MELMSRTVEANSRGMEQMSRDQDLFAKKLDVTGKAVARMTLSPIHPWDDG